jgi:hypothetical protein
MGCWKGASTWLDLVATRVDAQPHAALPVARVTMRGRTPICCEFSRNGLIYVQVGRKAQALVQFLGQQQQQGGGGGAAAHSMLVLAGRIVAQCEVQARGRHCHG